MAKELNKLRKIFKNIEGDKMAVTEQLVINAAFMAERLESLRGEIENKGDIIEYKNGREQYGTTANPALREYTGMIKEYRQIIKQLTELLTKAEREAEKDEMLEYLMHGK